MESILKLLSINLFKKYNTTLVCVLSLDGASGIRESLAEVLGKKFKAQVVAGDAESLYAKLLNLNRSDKGLALLPKIIPLALGQGSFPQVIILEMESSRDSIKKIKESGVVFNYIIVDSLVGNNGRVGEMRNLLKNLPKETKMIVNKSDKSLAKIISDMKIDCMTYSADDRNATVYALALSSGNAKWVLQNGKTVLTFKACSGSNAIPVRLEKVIGQNYVTSVIAAYPVGLAMGMNLVEITEALQNYRGVPGKMNLISGIKNTSIIDETKDANCESLKEAITALKKLHAIRKVAVVGDILNLGDEMEKAHRQIGKALALAGVDLLITIGTRAIFVKDEAMKAGIKEDNIFMYNEKEVADAGIFVQNKMKEGDLILVSGAKEMEMGKIVQEIKAEFKETPDLAMAH